MANHKPNNWRGETIEKGSYITSLSKISVETGLSIKQVRNCIKKLQSTGEIQIKGTKWTKVTICNYASYQQTEKKKGTTRARNGHAMGTTRATTNNDNNNNNDNNIYLSFVNWFNSEFNRSFKPLEKYQSKFIKLLDTFTIEDIKKAVRNAYSDSYHTETNHKYLTIEFFTRSDKIDKFINQSPQVRKSKFVM
jgi:hypothetical protein